MNSADRYGGWRNQYARMQRWETRAQNAIQNLPRTDFDDALDLALAYFVWCHSMRDWLIRDQVFERNALDNTLLEHPVWRIVRDVSNRSKHLILTQKPADAEWSVAREYDPFAIILEGRERHHLNLYFDGKKHRLSDVISRSSQMWRVVLGVIGS